MNRRARSSVALADLLPRLGAKSALTLVTAADRALSALVRGPSDVNLPGLWSAALGRARFGVRPDDFRGAWEGLVGGRLRICAQRSEGAHAMMIARLPDATEATFSPVPERESGPLVRVLRGEQQKLIASDLGLSCSTVSAQCARGLARLGVTSGSSVPLLVVLAAQSGTDTAARCGWSVSFEHQGRRCLLLGNPRRVSGLLPSLTRAEEEVAQLLVDGLSRREVALRRATSRHTIAGQTHSIFTKLRVSGRYALVRRVAQSMFCAAHDGRAGAVDWPELITASGEVAGGPCSFQNTDAARPTKRN
jgi:DNA-binding NarL/FixJ family response regulator